MNIRIFSFLSIFLIFGFLHNCFCQVENKERNLPIIPSEGVVDPEEYKVGPGDILLVSISGIDDFTYKAEISPEGSIYIPRIGGLEITNCSLRSAKEKIHNWIKKYFNSVDVFITLIYFRSIKIFLHGNVKNSGSVVLTANSRLGDLFNNSDNLLEKSDLRNIRITKNDGSISYFDYIALQRYGNKMMNPLIDEGSYVYIDKINKTVSIQGAVNFPSEYPFKENETVNQLIALAGGTSKKAKLDSLEIIRFDKDLINQYSILISFADLKRNDIFLESGDLVLIRELQEVYEDKYVAITGFVKYPGIYKIDDEKTKLSDVFSIAGGLLKNASLVDATLTRKIGASDKDPEFERLKLIPRENMTEDEYDYLKSKSRQRAGRVIVDFQKLLESKDELEDVLLRKGDIINIPEKKDYITIIGQAVNPGNIPYNKDLKPEDYIKLAGGYGWRALESDVRVVKVNSGEWVDIDDVANLEPGDTIWIPEDPPPAKFWDVFTQILTVLGQVATVIAATVAVIVSTR